jgi:hypothetical protein
MAKQKYIKFLKKSGLIPTTKQYEDMKSFILIMIVLSIVILSIVGMLKYPMPTHYYDNLSPTIDYRGVAYDDDLPECGNDPTRQWWKYV